MTPSLEKLFLLLPFILLFSCAGEDQNREAEEGYTTMPEDFKTFYKRFHRDSAYQMQHIVWPLEGLPANADSATVANDSFVWTREQWKLHRPFQPRGNPFERRFEAFGPTLIKETFISRRGNFGMLRRWAKINGEWHLIYYIGNNKLHGWRKG